jgi:two-component system response regulator YesN
VLDVLKNEMQTNNLHSLLRARDTVEAQMEFVTSLEHSVFLDNTLDQFKLEEDAIRAIQVKAELWKYLQTAPFIYDIAYYQENDDYIIAASSSSQKKLFFERMYHFENWSYEAFLEDLDQNNNGFFLAGQEVLVKTREKKNLVTFVRPLKGKRSVRCVMYIIDASFFENLMPSVEGDRGVSAIIGKDGEIIVGKGNTELIKDIPENMGALKDKQEHIRIQNKDYILSYVYSDNHQWGYITLIPESEISDRISQVNLLMFLMCFVAVVGGMVGVIFFMKQNYEPIKNLKSITNEIMEDNGYGSEIDHVTRVLKYLDQQNKRFSADATIKDIAFKERVIIKMLSGQYENSDQIMKKTSEAGIHLNKSLHCVAVYHMYNISLEFEQSIEDAFMGAKPKNIDILVRTQPEMMRILVTVGYDVYEESIIEKYLTGMLDVMECDMELSGAIGLGSSVHEISDISKSYKEGIKASEYRLLLYDQKIIHYEEIMLRQNDILRIQPKELSLYIKNKDTAGMEAFLCSALEEMKREKVGIKQINKQCNEFIYAMEKIINDVNRDYFIENPMYLDILDVLKYENIKELMEIIRIIGCDIIDHLNEMSGRTIVESLILYVKDNCFYCDFSTTSMAEEFKMSLPYLSQYFKSHVGMNLLDYVTNLKIEKAKELLRETSLAVKDVAENVGYYNVNSFNRRFKQVTDHTPGEYRKLKI